ncbi:hypothetical protein [Bacteroides cellulosilyticus]|jgi:hypothetical protein|uniref:Uncharacterized protein n=2 Tax=Bacteroides cellulosilyticus TaxID=246787 RepID=A0A412I007_9BACE|nr:hypothetical protein [Bacteroides cellulosilyticus]RGS30184.1 hypothetical protein DWX97_26540 [Bacteroides cellulosilyticus]
MFDAPATRGGGEWDFLCNGKMEGGCIAFGGWLKVVPSDGGKYAYCSYGGLGVGGWNHECSIYSIFHRIEELYSNAVRCVLISGYALPDASIAGAATDCIFLDENFSMVGIASTDVGIAALVGGSVEWKTK